MKFYYLRKPEQTVRHISDDIRRYRTTPIKIGDRFCHAGATGECFWVKCPSDSAKTCSLLTDSQRRDLEG